MRHTHISANHSVFDLKLGEVWQYRDLILLFTHRSFQVSYKQTVLGPLWLFINPLLTSLFQVILFGNIAKLSTDGVPQILFYLSGNALWGFFPIASAVMPAPLRVTRGCRQGVFSAPCHADFQRAEQHHRFGIQMLLLVVIYLYFLFHGMVCPNPWLLLTLPLILLVLGLLGMGVGIIISSLTTKYRDLSVLVGFGLQLWMYAMPIVYPMSAVDGTLKTVLACNPVTAPAELFRYALFGTGSVSLWGPGRHLPLHGFRGAVRHHDFQQGGAHLYGYGVRRCEA